MNTAFDYSVLVYPALALAFVVLAVVDVLLVLSRIQRAVSRGFERLFRHRASRSAPVAAAASGGHVPPEEEVCPTCEEKLVNGECPNGHTIQRCAKCDSVLKPGGACPKCGVGTDVEYCPACDSELRDGECPNGHTIMRCPTCDSVMKNGKCSKGCDADPLTLGWPGKDREFSAYALRVVSCPKHDGVGFTLKVPSSFLIGRSAEGQSEPFVEPFLQSRKEKAACSRTYVRLDFNRERGCFDVTLENESGNPATVGGRTLREKGSKAELHPGETISFNPKMGYELELIEASAG